KHAEANMRSNMTKTIRSVGRLAALFALSLFLASIGILPSTTKAITRLQITSTADDDPIPDPPATHSEQAPDDGKLELVVALFRHGVRAPLKDFADSAKDHSKQPWPTLDDWDAVGTGPAWGALTKHGWDLGNALGHYYAEYYRNKLGDPFRVFLWADVDSRTRNTAEALAWGFRRQGIPDVRVGALPIKDRVDPLFHP